MLFVCPDGYVLSLFGCSWLCILLVGVMYDGFYIACLHCWGGIVHVEYLVGYVSFWFVFSKLGVLFVGCADGWCILFVVDSVGSRCFIGWCLGVHVR